MPDRLSAKEEARFPNLFATGYIKSSDKDPRYNCVAWAADWDIQQWWDPMVKGPGIYWPETVLRFAYVENYMQAFGTIGYEPCDGPEPEPWFEKIAIYQGQLELFSHVAKQLPNGKWTSKLGRGKDIVHNSLDAFKDNDAQYGNPVRFMKRKTLGVPVPPHIQKAMNEIS